MYTTGEEGGKREGEKEKGREGRGRLYPIGLGFEYGKCFCSCTSDILELQAIICMHWSMRLGVEPCSDQWGLREHVPTALPVGTAPVAVVVVCTFLRVCLYVWVVRG